MASTKFLVPLAFASIALTACSAAPGAKDVQDAVDRLASEQPMLFGADKPDIKDAKCTKVGEESYDCVTSMAISSAPDEAHTVTVKMTKLSGKWNAQIPNIMQ